MKETTLFKFGNTKLPKTTLIFNMGSSKDCPSRKLGLCDIASNCYARKPERIYPQVLPYRNNQATYWTSTTAEKICEDMTNIINSKRKNNKPTLFRFNESGDFYTQSCITKLSTIAEYLLQEHNIVTYGYTARRDLDFSNASFLVKGSNNDAGNNGKTIVINTIEDLPTNTTTNFQVCPGDCKACDMCSNPNKTNIAFIKH